MLIEEPKITGRDIKSLRRLIDLRKTISGEQKKLKDEALKEIDKLELIYNNAVQIGPTIDKINKEWKLIPGSLGNKPVLDITGVGLERRDYEELKLLLEQELKVVVCESDSQFDNFFAWCYLEEIGIDIRLNEPKNCEFVYEEVTVFHEPTIRKKLKEVICT